ncbi:MAG: hypothetical protein C4310_08735 [Chloroflexota bacterium]
MSQKAPEAEFIVSSPVKKAEAAKLPVSDVTPTGFSTSVSQALPDVVQRIVQALQPKKIILFGSYAYGNPTPDSDVVILNQAPPGFALSRLVRQRAPVLPRPQCQG